MKSIKFLTYITAAFLFLVAPSVISAQVYCSYSETERYRAEDAVIHRGDNMEYIKWCCEKAFKDGTKPCNGVTKDGLLQHTAAKYKRTAVLEYLINDLGMEADLQNAARQTPVMFAAESGFIPTTKFLVQEKSVNVMGKDRDARDVLWYAKKSGNPEVIALVKEAAIKQLGLASAQEDAKAKEQTKAIKESIAQSAEVKTSKYTFIESQALALNQANGAQKDLTPQKI